MFSKKEKKSADKPKFFDCKGNPINAHSYVKDGEGNIYSVNSSFQVIPEEGGAVLMLSNLLDSTEVTVLSPIEVLRLKKAKEERRSAKAAAKQESPDKKDLFPVSLEVVLAAIPDKALADELRKRGYTLTASKPMLICL